MYAKSLQHMMRTCGNTDAESSIAVEGPKNGAHSKTEKPMKRGLLKYIAADAQAVKEVVSIDLGQRLCFVTDVAFIQY